MISINKICFAAFVGLLTVNSATAQETVVIGKPTARPEIVQTLLTQKTLKPETKEKLVALLKTMAADIGALGLPQNRVRYATDTAEMLWKHDEKAARAMFSSAANDLRFVIQQLDEAVQKEQNGESDQFDFFIGGSASATAYSTQNIRRELILSLANYDADGALALLNETRRDNYGRWNDSDLETRLTTIIAKNDVNKGYEMAMQKLSKNQIDGLSEVAAKIFAKDADKGAKLAAEIFKKMKSKSEDAVQDFSFSAATSLFSTGAAVLDNKENKAVFLNASEMRELGEILANKILQGSKTQGYFDEYWFNQVSAPLKKYSPAAFRRVERAANGESNANFTVGERAVSEAPELSDEPPPPPSVAVRSTVGGVAVGRGSAPMVMPSPNKAETEREAQQALIMEMTRLVSSKDPIDLTEVRKNLAKLKNKSQKLMILTQIAKAVAQRGDKEAAKTLLAENSDVVITNPRRAGEMIQALMLVEAYAEIEPERAFVLLEAMIAEVNPVISSLNRIGEFVGIQEFTSNGEFNMGSLPKEFLNFGGMPGGANLLIQPTFAKLAEADFDRFTGLTNKFERGEIRLETKMLIVKTLMPPAPETNIIP